MQVFPVVHYENRIQSVLERALVAIKMSIKRNQDPRQIFTIAQNPSFVI